MKTEDLWQFIKWEEFPKNQFGGQSIGRVMSGATLVCDEVGFRVTVDYSKSMLKNKEVCLTLLELYLMEAYPQGIKK